MSLHNHRALGARIASDLAAYEADLNRRATVTALHTAQTTARENVAALNIRLAELVALRTDPAYSTPAARAHLEETIWLVEAALTEQNALLEGDLLEGDPNG